MGSDRGQHSLQQTPFPFNDDHITIYTILPINPASSTRVFAITYVKCRLEKKKKKKEGSWDIHGTHALFGVKPWPEVTMTPGQTFIIDLNRMKFSDELYLLTVQDFFFWLPPTAH